MYIGKTKYPDARFNQHTRGNIKSKIALGIHSAIKKYGAKNMTYRVLGVLHSEEEAYRVEAALIAAHNTVSPHGYNLQTGGNGGFTVSEKTREKLRWNEARKGKMSLLLSGAGNPMFGKKWSPEVREKIIAKRIGKTRSPEHYANLSLALTGKRKSPEHRAHLSRIKRGKPVPASVLAAAIVANTGRPLSENHKQKLRHYWQTHVYPGKGKKLTAEHREKISAAGRGRIHSPETKQKMAAAKSAYWARRHAANP